MARKSLLILVVGLVISLGGRSILLAAQKPTPIKRVYTERMAGFDKTVVLTDEKVPSSCVFTYFQHGIHYVDANYLVKIMPSLEISGKFFMPSQAQDLKVEDFPGGVTARFRIDSVQVETKIRPLMVGRKKNAWEGAVLYQVKTDPKVPVIIHIGGGKTLSLLPGRNLLPLNYSDVRKDTVSPLRHPVIVNDHTVRFKSGAESIPVIVKTSGALELKPLETDSLKDVSISMNSGSGQILVGFADNENRLLKIGEMNYETAKEKVDRYYSRLLKSAWIKTPDRNMNAAFRSAIYNLEYNYIKPYGWMECLHHWYALFQQQVSPAAEWLGQIDRSKSCIWQQATHLIQGGNIAQFMPDGVLKRDFGGSNQYWAWQVRHYINFTDDTAFARRIIPYFDKVLARIIHQHDKDGDMLFSWGLQIGNQEDFIGNPGDATNPSIELVNMFRTRAELSDLIGDKKSAKLYREKADEVIQQLQNKLWLPDLGRFAYFKDLTGNVRLDGQYETYLYPIIWNIVDPLDQYTGLRHLLDHLTGKNGAIFCSNNFSWHAVGTWGMQSGEAQQPWAAWGFSKFGLNNMTWRPLNAMADWTMDINHRGAWPEISTESTPAYFTPPAGLYIASTIEALFGLNMDAPRNTIKISPSFPDSWPNAELALPGFKVDYHRDGYTMTYTLETKRHLEKEIRWRLPACKIMDCLVNGNKVSYKLKPYVDHVILCVNAGHSHKTKILVQYVPLKYHISYPRSIAGGDTLHLKASGMTINRIDDRCGVLSSCSGGKKSITAVVKEGLLRRYLKYGRLGQLNFSRRTFFVHGRLSGGLALWFPVNLTVLPGFEAAPAGQIRRIKDGYAIGLRIRNNTFEGYEGTALLQIHQKDITFKVHVRPRSQIERNISIPSDIIGTLSPGDNQASLYMKGSRMIPLTLTADKISKYLPSSCSLVDLPLPKSKLMPDTLWNTLRVMPGFPHIFFMFSNYGWPKPMLALADSSEISVPQIPGLTFKIPHRKFIPVSHLSGHELFRLKLRPAVYKKLYLLVIPFVDNHDVFSKVARVTAYSHNEIAYTRTLHYPGDIDYWVPNINPYTFATYRGPRGNRFGLLPLLKPSQSAWSQGKPPQFPEPKYWATSIPVVTKSCLMDVIEIDLSRPMRLSYLDFESIGAYTAFGIVGAVGEVENGGR